jgi:hypothetical protein
VIDRGDRTPIATRIALVATLAITGGILALFELQRLEASEAADVAPLLWILTVLFVVRVTGQMLVVLRAPSWLPPMEQWNLLPYPILLPIQLVFVGVMLWIDVSFTRGHGVAVDASGAFGTFLIGFSALYAASMVVRYVVRMRRRPGERWFGGTIPIVFHIVLASYLYVLGSFYAAR